MNEIKTSEQVIDMHEMEDSYFLIGLLNEFVTRFQTVGDRFFSEVSWKQGFMLSCIQLFPIPPTLSDLSEIMGCSHQNVKQMLIKLQKMEYIELVQDKNDRRKQRVLVTKKAKEFCRQNDPKSKVFMDGLFAPIDKEKLKVTINTIMKLDESLKQQALNIGGDRI